MNFDELLARASRRVSLPTVKPTAPLIPLAGALSLRCCELMYRAVPSPSFNAVYMRAFAFRGMNEEEYVEGDGFCPLSDMLDQLKIAQFGGPSLYALTDGAKEMVESEGIKIWIERETFNCFNSSIDNSGDPEGLHGLYLIPLEIGIPPRFSRFPMPPKIKIPDPIPFLHPAYSVWLRASYSFMEPVLLDLMSKSVKGENCD